MRSVGWVLWWAVTTHVQVELASKSCFAHSGHQLQLKTMSSGLTAPKCPSCKIIILRPIYQISSANASPSRKNPSIMHCPACENQYSIRKGAILPAILLNSSSSSSYPSDERKAGGYDDRAGVTRRMDAAPVWSPLGQVLQGQNVYPSPSMTELMSPGFNTAIIALSLGQSGQHTPVQLLPSCNLPTRSRSFNAKKDIADISSPMLR